MFGILTLACATSVIAQDWPQWRGTNRDGKVTKFVAPKSWPAALTQKWKITVGLGDATPALVGKKLYVFARQGDNEVTLCLNAATGDKLWEDKYQSPSISGPASGHPGPRSSPSVASGKVITMGVYGTLSCLDAVTGKLIWRKDDFPGTMPTFGTAMSPIIVDKVCIAHLGGKDNGAIVAYDLATGDQKWKTAADGPSYSSPTTMTVAGTKQLVIYTDKNLEGIALADGKILWQVPVQPIRRYYNSATPVVDGQTVYCTGQGQGTKAILIEKTADGFGTKELWNNKDLGVGYCSPVLEKGMLFGLSDKGSYFGMNAMTGQTLWIDTVTRKESYMGMVDAGSVIFGLPNDSTLSVFEPSATAYTELAKYKVADTATYAFPIVSGKNIYIKDQESLTLWMLP
jgi:outer membrane protein assembly factor BamB